MRLLLPLLIAACALAPGMAYAHATPVSYEPASSAALEQAPAEASIRFSERLEEGASALVVEGPAGVVSRGRARVGSADPRILAVALDTMATGTYKATWSVVSADDGHFTKGSYFFAIGTSLSSSSTGEGFELVTRNLVPEALGMTIELMGNGLLWAVLVLWAFALRPLMGKFSNERPLVERILSRFVFAGVGFILVGGLFQLFLKGGDLAMLQEIAFGKGLALYAGTASGAATLWRMAAGALFASVFAAARSRVFRSHKFSWQEGALMAALAVFAYFRAIISHATANPFHPELSITVNFFHVIEKDFWAGVVAVLLAITLSPRLRALLGSLIPRVFVIMAFSAATVAATAAYIVWLHLKSFDNLFSTAWGSAFLQLGAVAALLVIVRTVQTVARLRWPSFFARRFSTLLGVELALGILVVYCSSVAILTSPPLPEPHTAIFQERNEGLTLRLERSDSEDDMLLLTAGTLRPTVTLGGAAVELTERFPGGYVIPTAILSDTPQELLIVSPQAGAYDARASFTLAASDFAVHEGWESSRPFDMFTVSILLLALCAVLYALILATLSLKESPFAMSAQRGVSGAVVGSVLMFSCGVLLLWGLPASGVSNPYKGLCEGDGNMWHFMLPSKAGVATSQTPKEGCMWGMGNYMYMFSDKREYTQYRSFSPAEVTLEHSPVLKAGVPAELTIALAEPDGTPATLFVDMEKLVHLVIVSKDQSVFAHIHAAQTPEERSASRFRFSYMFPKAGEYLLSIDYAHGLTLESRQFKVMVQGAPQQGVLEQYPTEGTFGGYRVSLKYPLLIAGEPQLLRYSISKNGAPAENLEQYLSAAMHVSVVKDDFTQFLHLHGEVHATGTPPLPVRVVNGKIVHNMAAMLSMPLRFGPDVETHVIFPTPGLYTVWGEFKADGVVVPTAFTVRVEE